MDHDSNVAISVQSVSKSFKLPHERHASLKGAIINFYKKNRSYEKQQVLKNVSFEIKKGDFFAIVGRNGSGKSTLLKLLAGIYTPNKGGIEVNGVLTPFIELGVGFNPELTGRENVFLNGALLGFNRAEVDAMYDDIVSFAELEKFMDQKLKNYSSGMQVRLAFSIAIRARSDILLLDEVLAVGDAAFQQKCYDYFEELKLQKKTVVFVSHDMSAVRRFCTDAVYIKDGELLFQGTPAEVADIYMESNINTGTKEAEKDEPAPPNAHKVSTKIISQTAKELKIAISYQSKDDEEKYIGLSVLRDGISVAEITSQRALRLTTKGTVSYTIDLSVFNGGVYYIGVGLFRSRNRELLAAGKVKSKFVIRGDDDTRGAALKLDKTWESGVQPRGKS